VNSGITVRLVTFRLGYGLYPLYMSHVGSPLLARVPEVYLTILTIIHRFEQKGGPQGAGKACSGQNKPGING